MRRKRPNVTDPGRVIAHRGASRVAPENTLAAFRAARAQGVWWVEFDVMLLGDGTAVVHHDATLERCTNGTGALGALGAADLGGLSAARGHGAAFRGESLPTLAQALDLFDDLGVYANLEIKRHDLPAGEIAGQVAQALAARAWTRERILISSFDLGELAALRERMPDAALAGLFQAPPRDWRAMLADLDAAAIHLRFDYLSQRLLNEATSFGYDVRVYTINEPSLMVPFRKLGLTGVITDHPPLFLEDADWAVWAQS